MNSFLFAVNEIAPGIGLEILGVQFEFSTVRVLRREIIAGVLMRNIPAPQSRIPPIFCFA